MRKAFICYLRANPNDQFQLKVLELEGLARAAGYDVVGTFVQTGKPDPRHMLGSGKIREVAEKAEEGGVDTVIFYNQLSAKQQFNLERALRREIIDRYDLTLKIFEAEATDMSSKLQIKLARLLKEVPYRKMLTSMKFKMGREHPGPMGFGEYAYHREVSMLMKAKARAEGEITRRLRMHKLLIEKRRERGIPIVCIAGYYNAGKTSLFNTLTGLSKRVGEEPFTTLSSKYYLIDKNGFLFYLVDTIGFVVDLDPRLIHSFRLTLEDIASSDLVLLAADVSDREEILRLRTEASLGYLSDLGVSGERILIAFNKVDRLDPNAARERVERLLGELGGYDYVLVSAKKKINIEELAQRISEKLPQRLPAELGGAEEGPRHELCQPYGLGDGPLEGELV